MFLDNLPPTIKVYYDTSGKNWVAFYADNIGNQVGDCSYGASKKDAIFNLTH